MTDARKLNPDDDDNSKHRFYLLNSPDNKSIRLFPLSSMHTAAWCATNNDSKKDQNLTIAIYGEKHFAGRHSKNLRSTNLQNLGTLNMLSSGYYFQNSISTNLGTKEKFITSHLGNAIDGDSCYLHELLDPSIIAEAGSQLLGVSNDRKTIYTYQFNRTGEKRVDSNDPFVDDYHYSTSVLKPDIFSNKTAINLYTLPDGPEKIENIACVYNSTINKSFLIMALNTGEIRFALLHYTHSRIESDFGVLLPKRGNESDSQIKLFAGKHGVLLAHLPDTKQIFCWDFSTAVPGMSMHWCPNMHNVSLSACGMYLTGLCDQDATVSNVVFCLDLHTHKTHNIRLPVPVEDFVIGGLNGQVCIPGHEAYEAVIDFKKLDFTSGMICFGKNIKELLATHCVESDKQVNAHIENSMFKKRVKVKVARKKEGYEDGLVYDNPLSQCKK